MENLQHVINIINRGMVNKLVQRVRTSGGDVYLQLSGTVLCDGNLFDKE